MRRPGFDSDPDLCGHGAVLDGLGEGAVIEVSKLPSELSAAVVVVTGVPSMAIVTVEFRGQPKP